MKTNSTSSLPLAVSEEDIARRAREIWLSRGSPEGQDVEIWLLAERELRTPLAAPAPRLTKTGRKARSASAKSTDASEVIDVGELQDRLTRFGDSPQRSPTSLDVS